MNDLEILSIKDEKEHSFEEKLNDSSFSMMICQYFDVCKILQVDIKVIGKFLHATHKGCIGACDE
jgi:hypothetical protein